MTGDGCGIDNAGEFDVSLAAGSGWQQEGRTITWDSMHAKIPLPQAQPN
jgi:hypothetical protein